MPAVLTMRALFFLLLSVSLSWGQSQTLHVASVATTGDTFGANLTIHNGTTQTISVRFKVGAGIAAAPTSTSPVYTWSEVPTGYTLAQYGTWTAPDSIAAGSNGSVLCSFNPQKTVAGDGTFFPVTTFTVPVYIKKASETLWPSTPIDITFTKTIGWEWVSSGYGASPNPYTWGTYNFTGTEPDAGHIQVTCATAGHVRLFVGTELKFDGLVTAGQVVTWDTAVPAPFIGQEIVIEQDGVLYVQNVIIENMRALETDPETGLPASGIEFNYSFAFKADGQPDPKEAPKPNGPPDKSNAPANTTPGQYSGRDPGSAGTEAKTNLSAPDTVKENYESTRQAVEDALNGNAGENGEIVSADVSEKGSGGGGTGPGTGAQIGAGVGQGLGALGGIGGLSVPGGSGLGASTIPGFNLPFIFGHSVFVPVPSWAGVVWWLVLILTTFQTLIFMVRAARSAFSTAN